MIIILLLILVFVVDGLLYCHVTNKRDKPLGNLFPLSGFYEFYKYKREK